MYRKGGPAAGLKGECVQVGRVSLAECVGVCKSIMRCSLALRVFTDHYYMLAGKRVLAVQTRKHWVFTPSPHKV